MAHYFQDFFVKRKLKWWEASKYPKENNAKTAKEENVTEELDDGQRVCEKILYKNI